MTSNRPLFTVRASLKSNKQRRRAYFVLTVVVIALTVGAAVASASSGSLGRFLRATYSSVAGSSNNAAATPQRKRGQDQLKVAAQEAATMNAQMVSARRGHTATNFEAGKVLIAGGDSSGSAEIFDAATGTFYATGGMSAPRSDAAAVSLGNGRVLIVGGTSYGAAVSSTEIYDSAAGTFSAGPNMGSARSGASATVLSNGNILIAGGDAGGSAEIYNPTSNAFSGTGSMDFARSGHSAALMNDDKVLIVGGRDADGNSILSGEIFDPASGSFAGAGAILESRVGATMRVLFDGKVQIIGGNDHRSIEIYDPAEGIFDGHAHVPPTDDDHADLINQIMDTSSRAALFNDGETITEIPSAGKAVVIGGGANGSATNAASVYDSSPASVSTDKLDYSPGSTVHVSGRGWQPNETVTIMLHEDPHVGTENPHTFSVAADGDGSFEFSQFAPQDEDFGVSYILGATGSSGSRAQTVFHDAIADNLDGFLNNTGVWGGTANGTNSKYSESEVVPLRYKMEDVPVGTHTVTLSYDFFKTSSPAIHFIDQLTTFDANYSPDPLLGLSGYGSFTTVSIPADAYSGVTAPANTTNIPAGGSLRFYAGSGTATATVGTFGSYTGTTGVRSITLTFTVAGSGTKDVLLVYGGHLASPLNWGAGNGAFSYPGGSGKGYGHVDGQSDTNFSLQSSAVIPQTTLSFNALSPSTSVYGSGTTVLTATLINASSNTPISGATINFYLNNSNPDNSTSPNGTLVGSAVTNASGIATLNVTTPFANLATRTVSGSPYSLYVGGTYAGSATIGSSFGFGSMTITQKPATITADDRTKSYGTSLSLGTTAFTTSGIVTANGDAVSAVTLTSTGGLAGSTSAAGGTYPGNIVPSAPTGTGISNYSFTFVNGALEITQPTLTITATNQSKTYGDTFVPDGTLAAGQFTVTGLQGGDSVSSVTLSSPGYVNTAGVAGSPYTITPSSAVGTGLSNYTIVYNTGTLTVNVASLTITASSAGVNYGDAAPTITPGYSGFVNGDTAASLSPGPTCSTVYTQGSSVAGSPYGTSCSGAANSNYTISYVPGSVTVSAVGLTITASSASVNYGDAAPTITPGYSGFVNGDTAASLSPGPTCSTVYTQGSSVAGSPYGTSCSGAANSNYTISYVPGSVTVSAVGLTITASSASVNYGDAAPTITPGYSGFVNGDTAASLSPGPTCSTVYTQGSSVAGSPYGTSCSGAANSNYTISYVPGSVTVSAVGLTITASSASVNYGDAAPTITPGYSGFVNGDTAASLSPGPTCSTVYTQGSSVAGSPYGTSCSGAANSNYTISYVPGSVTVSAVGLTITASSASVNYGDAAPTITPGYSGFVNGDTASSLSPGPTCSTVYTQGSSVAGSPYGTSCSGAANSNYTISYVPGSVTVSAVGLTITASSAGVNYGDAAPTITPGYSGFVNGDTAASLSPGPTCSTVYTQGSSVAGSPYGTSCSGAANSNYTISYVPGSVTVSAVGLTITASSASVNYGDAAPTITPGYSGFVNGDTAASLSPGPTCSTVYTQGSSVAGSPYGTSCSGAANSNYTISYVPGSVTVSAVGLTITASSASVNYGDAAPTITPGYSGFVNGDTAASLSPGPTCSTVYTQGSSVAGSPYGTSCSGAANSNYTISYVPGSVTVSAVGLTITASSASVNYGDAAPTITPGYSGFVNGDTAASLSPGPTCSTVYTQGSSVAGSPYGTSCSGAANSNYTISYVPGSVTVSAVGLTITASSASVNYGDAAPTITPGYSGFVNGDTAASLSPGPTCSTVYTQGSSVAGSPYGTSCSGAANSNYTISYVPGSVTVSTVVLTVTANSTSRYYGQANPVFTASYSGFKNGETLATSDVTGSPSLATAATGPLGSPVGPYAITAANGTLASTNYTFSFVNGTLTINPDPTAITLDNKTSGANFDCENNTYTATLKDTITDTGISGVDLKLTIGTQSVTATTNGSGVATFTLTLDQATGVVTETVALAPTFTWTDTNRTSPPSVSRPFTVNPDINVGPGTDATSLYTGSLFFWTTGPSSSTATLTLSATVQDTGACAGNITKAKVSFDISTNGGSSFSPVASAQNLPVGLVDPNNSRLGAASAISQYNIGNNQSISLIVRVRVGGEYLLVNPSIYDLPITIGKPGQANSLIGGGQLSNDGSPFFANGYLGLKSINSVFSSYVVYNKKGINPQGQMTVTIRSCNKRDGTIDAACDPDEPDTHHVYWIKSNSISELSLISGSASFGSKTNGYELLPDGTKVNFDSGNSLQIVFTPYNQYIPRDMNINGNTTTKCLNTAGCASIVLFRSAGGVWYSSSWGQGPGTPAPHTYEKFVENGTVAVSGTGSTYNAHISTTVLTDITSAANPSAESFRDQSSVSPLGGMMVGDLSNSRAGEVSAAGLAKPVGTNVERRRSFVGRAQLDNDGSDAAKLFSAYGSLGSNWVSSLFDSSVQFVSSGTDAEGAINITVRSCNKPDGSLDRRCVTDRPSTHHVYLIETNALSGASLMAGGTAFTSKANVYEVMSNGTKVLLDTEGFMQMIFVAKDQMIPLDAGAAGGTTCMDNGGCVALAAQKSAGGLWYSGAWGLTSRASGVK